MLSVRGDGGVASFLGLRPVRSRLSPSPTGVSKLSLQEQGAFVEDN